ncbi:beta-N-acetylhexosaminidase family protein [Pleomorphovibrio marinus]|uniref:carbohydrate-binding family 6 protein n=1 Tax=Pleomorphovibrio marinus TaxID=2164132 RepID=UPI000E0A6F2A|nr:carbohydrate-binding family 6 protein [Pleomorphovibrio marinus]
MLNNLLNSCCLFLVASVFFVNPAFAHRIFVEEEGLLVVEMTSLSAIGDWKSESTSLAGQPIQYIYSEKEYFQNPGQQLLSYRFRIDNPGTYKFIWHNKVGEGASPTDYNDTWLRIPDADDFFAQNEEGHVLHPRGVCEEDCPNGTGGAGWFKVYSHGTTDWTWRTKTSDHDPHEIYAQFNQPGIYSIQVSARSSYHFLSKFVLFQPDKYSEAEVTGITLPTSEWVVGEHVGPLEFGLKEIETALAEMGLGALKEVNISHEIVEDLNSEGFHLKKGKDGILIQGGDEAGLMYGCLELAEQIRLFGLEGIEEIRQSPHMEMRGTKFNIPLDMRTPSYTDASDAAQHNIAHMWDMEFWKTYIDNLARNRFNYISLWNLHPFPSMVKVPDYPDVALDDVHRSTVNWEEYYHLHATGLDAPEIIENYEVIREIKMEDKIRFWQEVMAYAKSRNIGFYIVTWNIFTNGTDGKYGINDDIQNEITRDYFRSSISELFRTYPDLKGIGLTTGENMHNASFQEKEDWAFDTYARAILEVATEVPDRQFTFIHRQHQTGAREIMEKFKPLLDQQNVDFIFSFKYAQAHVYSAVEQPFHKDFIKEIGSVKTIWGLRNDDIYYFRWGAPDFVRAFIGNLPTEPMKGIYYGSDQWVWGRDFLSKDLISTPGQLEILKHWYQWMLWGRLSFDPTVDNKRFQQILQNRFPETDGPALFDAWQAASMVYPITTGFHWGALDFQWYIEGCKSRPEPAGNDTGFHDVNRFISLGTHPGSGYQSIPDYVKGNQDGGDTSLTSPIEVSEMLHQKADKALGLMGQIHPGEDRELKVTVQDILTISYMGKYYAHKIAGATYLALFRESGEPSLQDKAVAELEAALEYWKQYKEAALKHNKHPLWTNRVGYVDFEKTTEWVEEDIAIAKKQLRN